VGNAIKFYDVGEVVIKAAKVNGLFEVTVRDSGPGISETDQASYFRNSSRPTIRHAKEGWHPG